MIALVICLDICNECSIFRNVQAILKSSDLDKKYEKFSTASGNQSPGTGRRKFLPGRTGAAAKRRARQRRSPSKGRGGVNSGTAAGGTSPTRNGSSSNVSVTTGCSSMEIAGSGLPLGIIGHSLGSTDDQVNIPAQVANKYNVGDVIGDGKSDIIKKVLFVCLASPTF